MSTAARSPLLRKRVVLPLVGLVLLLVIALDTTFLTAAEVKKLNPPAFDAETYGREAFPKAAKQIAADAVDVTDLAPAVDGDLAAAARKYGYDLGSGSYSFPLKATGTVTKVDDDFVELDVPDVPEGTEVRIPLGLALTGTPVRDAAGITFGDFAGQTDFQSAANQFKLRMQDEVLDELDTKGLEGKELTVTGGWNTGGPPKSFIVQPTSIAVGG